MGTWTSRARFTGRASLLALLLAACGSGSRTSGPPASRDLDLANPAHATPGRATGSIAAATPSQPDHRVEPPAPVGPIAPVAPVAPPAPVLPPPGPTLELMKWGADTRSFQLRSSEAVYAQPDSTSTALGKIVVGTRLPLAGAAVGVGRDCKAWLAVLPAGWICARRVKPSPEPPVAAVLPEVPAGALLPQKYYGVTKGGQRFKDADAVLAGIPLPEPKAKSSYMVTKGDVVDVDGVSYITTGVGLVAADDLYEYHPSRLAGIDLVATPPPAWPFAWVTGKTSKALTIRAEPVKKAAEAGTVTLRQVVPVLEEKDGYVRIGDAQWLPRTSVQIARKRTRPTIDGVAGTEPSEGRWIDVDRDDQVMIAYDHDLPVYATLVSSGHNKKDTPPALYRIRSKAAVTKMAAEEREASHYEVSEVPWATRFRSGLYFHAAYWHDDFGTARSHGCVNLAPRDAKWVYDWTAPTMPPGWSELEVPMAGAMIVRVYDVAHVDPPVFDYKKEAVERVKVRKREAQLKKAREAAEAAAAAGEVDPATPTTIPTAPAAPAAPPPAVPAPTVAAPTVAPSP